MDFERNSFFEWHTQLIVFIIPNILSNRFQSTLNKKHFPINLPLPYKQVLYWARHTASEKQHNKHIMSHVTIYNNIEQSKENHDQILVCLVE